jgi:hypothetical protein
MTTDFRWLDNEANIFMTGLTERLAEQIASEVETIALAIAPMSRGPKRGKLKASVGHRIEHDYKGVSGIVYSLWYGRFLDPKARQLRRLYPFLPTALHTVIAGNRFARF